VITALEAARVTIRAQHPEVPATVVITGTGDNQKGHAAADMAGVPDMLGCPVRELADELTPALRRPARRGPARTRCSVHLRPVEHATNRQRVIGDPEHFSGGLHARLLAAWWHRVTGPGGLRLVSV
jgi:hypothetical protein